jgi:hypothetical protein
MGDFNYPGIDWRTKTSNPCGTASVEGTLFYECIEENFFTQHVVSPTRDNNKLDLVISSDPEMVSEVQDRLLEEW